MYQITKITVIKAGGKPWTGHYTDDCIEKIIEDVKALGLEYTLETYFEV
jgi:hypothetical protein